MSITIPPFPIEDKAIATAVEELKRLTAKARAAYEERRLLDNQRDRAEREDTQAYAQALRAGATDPGTPRQRELDEALTAAKRKEQALDRAVVDVEAELEELLEQRGPAWASTIEKQIDKSRARVATAAQALQAASEDLIQRRSALAWLQQPSRAKFGGDLQLPVSTRSGDFLTVAQVVSAIETVLSPAPTRPDGAMPVPS